MTYNKQTAAYAMYGFSSDEGVDMEMAKKLRIDDPCNDCPYRNMCAGDCQFRTEWKDKIDAVWNGATE